MEHPMMVPNKCKSRLDDHEGDYNSMKGTECYCYYYCRSCY